MQIGESIAVTTIQISDDGCPLEPHKEQTGFTQKKRPSQKSVAELRSAMNGGRSTKRWVENGDDFKEDDNEGPEQSEPGELNPPITICDVEYPLSVAAHHLIPGKASLPKSKVTKFIWASKGYIKSDIGYDVDGSENGLWMPTHQVMSRAMGRNRTIFVHENEGDLPDTPSFSWRQLSNKAKADADESEASYASKFLPRYTQQAMIAMKTQFHDSHSNYNTLVKKRLDTLDFQLNRMMGVCEKCKKDTKPFPPAYKVVYYLNNVSYKMRGKITGTPTRSWRRTYTSDYAKRYAEKPLPSSDLKG